jgi:hypothetical protein
MDARVRKQIDPSLLEAKELLVSPDFFNRLLADLKADGLVGEEKNALALYLIASSRVLDRPLNAMIKGRSSVGKNFLVNRVLGLFPSDEIVGFASSSDNAWNYAGDSLCHKVLYLYERNETTRAVHPARLFISEGQITRTVTAWEDGERVLKTYIARGPISFISTTTKRELTIDDETRHISLYIDESAQQTKAIAESYRNRRGVGLTPDRRLAWQQVQYFLKQRAQKLDLGSAFRLPTWFSHVEDGLFVDDVRVRRYYPAFIEACCTVCLLRSFQRYSNVPQRGFEVDFKDFAIATLIFDSIFVHSLHGGGEAAETRQAVERIMARSGGPSVGAADLAQELRIPRHHAYALLRQAVKEGTLRRANRPEKDNRKLFVPVAVPRFVPDPAEIFKKASDVKEPVKFLHPITGKSVVYRRTTNDAD